MKAFTKPWTLLGPNSFGKERIKKRKYHMVKWEALNRPKDFGGLGFTDVRAMNTCLVAKWLARLETNDSSMCCELLRKKNIWATKASFKSRGYLDRSFGEVCL